MARLRRWLAAGGIAAFVFAAGTAEGQTRGGAGFWLMGLPTGGQQGGVLALSRDGSVAGGFSYIPQLPGGFKSFGWTEAGGRDDWGLLPGLPEYNYVSAMDSSGQIVAGAMQFLSWSGPRVFRRVGNGPLEDLGALAGWDYSYASGISGDGTIIAGQVLDEVKPPNPSQYGEAFRWTAATGLQGLGYLTPGSTYSAAAGISRDGSTIVGANRNEVLWYQAFTWREGEGMKALPTLSGAFTTADGVNSDGSIIVGRSGGADGFSRMVRWKSGSIEDLTAGGWPNSWGITVSDDGSVIGGTISGGGSSTAIVWVQKKGILTASDYLASMGVSVPNNYTPQYIYAISGDGRTFGGYARNTATNKIEGFVARIPGGSACIPDCDESGKLDINDFICFQTFFALGDPKADCDASGGLDIDDFICFQTNFAIGC